MSGFLKYLVALHKDELQNVWLFGQSVLYTEQPILREEVPEGWHCYDLRGTASDPKRPHELLDRTNQNFAGSILSAVPLMRGAYPKQAGPGQLLADRHPGHPDGLTAGSWEWLKKVRKTLDFR